MKNKKIKKIIIYTLVAMIVSTSVFFSYEKASSVKASAFSIPLVYEAMLTVLAMGGIYISYDWITDGNNALQLWNECEEEYNEQRLTVINGGLSGGGEDPEEDPNDIPEWEVLTGGIVNQGFLNTAILGSSLNLTLGVISKLCSFLASDNEITSSNIAQIFPNLKIYHGFSISSCNNSQVINKYYQLINDNMLDFILVIPKATNPQRTFLIDFDNAIEKLDYCITYTGSEYRFGIIGNTSYRNSYYGYNDQDALSTNSRSYISIPTNAERVIYLPYGSELYIDNNGSPVLAEYEPVCIFRKNCASVPEERSAIPLQAEQSSAG